MIAKVIAAPKGKSSMIGLARYISGIESVGHPVGWPALADYITDAHSNGARVDYVRLTNLESVELGPAVAEMMVTQAKNSRVKEGNVYHMVVAFPPGEIPTRAQLDDIEDALVASIGLQDHQRMSAAHDDKDHFHIHIAINKIHPETLRCVTPRRDHPKLMEACAALELRHGLTVTNHGLSDKLSSDELSVGARAADMEAHDGRQSFASWLSIHAAGPLRDAAATAKSWGDLHEAAAKLDLRFVLRGAGLAITTEDGRVGAKASSVDRSLSLIKLSERLGAFEARTLMPEHPPENRYEQRPREKGDSASALFAVYTQERNAALAARLKDREAQTARARDLNNEIQQRFATQRERLRRSNRPAAAKRLLYGQLARNRRASWADARAAIARARDLTGQQNPLPTWTGFLQDRAGRGDTQALALLRQRKKAQAIIGDAIRAAGSVEAGRDIVLRYVRPKAQRNGDLVYDVRSGGRVIDTKNLVRVDEISEGSAFLALAIAAERFKGRSLRIDGSVEFQNAVVAAAVTNGFNVHFEDAKLEARRTAGLLGAAPPQSNATAPSISAAGPLDAFIDRSNETGANERSAGHYRAWAASDVGSCLYKGLWALEDGSEVMVMRRGGVMLVKPATADDLSQAPSLRIGDTVTVNAIGSISRVQGLRR